MARPKKATVDYFPHFIKTGKTIYTLESKFGNDGYSFWFKLLEIIGATEHHFIDCNNPDDWEFLLAKTRLNGDIAENILNLLARLSAINTELWKEKIIRSDNFISNLTTVYSRRNVSVLTNDEVRDLCIHKHPLSGVSADINPDDENRNPQSKVKESKVKESKVKDTLQEKRTAQIPYQEIVDLYTQNCTKLPSVSKLTDKRKEKIKVRWNEHPDMDWWQELFTRINASEFLTGGGPRGWKADIDWIVNSETNMVGVLEGKYDQVGKPQQNTIPQKGYQQRKYTDDEFEDFYYQPDAKGEK